MKAMLALAALVFATGGAFAADAKKEPSEAQKAQQEKMKSCNATAKEKALLGNERKQFMSNCLKAAPAKATQQDKMTSCNAEAASKELKGDERKAFMSTCLKG